MSGKCILILATLDTKGPEARFVKDHITAMGEKALIMDVGVVGTPPVGADIGREKVASAGGTELEILLSNPSRETAAPVMAEGAKNIALEMASKGHIDGVLGLGGTQGTTLCTTVMRALPYGFPKVMVSTMASGNVGPWVDIKDITMMFSVTDIMGLNPVMRKILANAAGAVCGMANVPDRLEKSDKPLVAITTVGITTKGAMKAAEIIQAAGYETIIFHAIGSGGRAMEQMMKEGLIGAVLDYSTIEVSNNLFPALLNGGSERLTAAGDLGLPQVICPGAIEVLVFNEPETVPEAYRGREIVRHSPKITDLRLDAKEMALLGREICRRLSHTKDKAYFVIPVAGYDSYAVKGQKLCDFGADAAFTAELKKSLPPNIELMERDTHIEDPEFATECARLLIGLIEEKHQF